MRCGKDCRSYRDGLCPRCDLHEKVTALLTGPDGSISQALRPLHRALVDVPKPRSILNWLHTSAGPKILAAMAVGELAISHEALDRLPQTKSLDFLRDLLVAGHVLAPRQTEFARLEPWLDGLLATVPEGHAKLVRIFATWEAFRRLRPKAATGRLTESASQRARNQVRQALTLLAWLDQQGKTLTELRQDDLDRWLAAGKTTRLNVRAFLQWAKARRLTGDLHVPLRTSRGPAAPVADDERWTLIERLLHDQKVPVDLRVAGLFALLYGQPLTRIVRLTTDHITHASDKIAIRFGNDDLVLPDALGQLTLALRDRRGRAALGNQTRPWLFPGGAPGRHITANSLQLRLKGVGVILRAARNAAMLQLAAEIPAPVLADLFHLHPVSAARLIKTARGDWTSYVGQRSTPLNADPIEPFFPIAEGREKE